MDKIKNNKILSSTFFATFFMFALYIYSPFLVPYLVEQGFAKDLISFMFSGGSFILIITSAVLGKLSDDAGRKRIIGICLILEIIAIIFYLVTKNNIYIFIPADLLSIVAISGYEITMLQKEEDGIKKHRGRLTGIFESFQGLGALLGTLAGTFIVSIFPINTTFKISLILFLLLLALNSFTKDKRRSFFKLKDFNFLEDIKEFWRVKNLKGIGILGIAAHFTLPAIHIFIPLFIIQELGGSIADVGLFASILAFSHLTQVFAGFYCDIYSSYKVVIYSFIIVAVSYICMFFVPNVTSLFALSIILGIASSFWNTGTWCYMSDIGERKKEEGMVTGSYFSIAKIGAVLGFLLSGLIVTVLGTKILFVIYGFVILLSIFIANPYLARLKNLNR